MKSKSKRRKVKRKFTFGKYYRWSQTMEGLECHSRKPTDTRVCSIELSFCGTLTGAKHSVIWPIGLENTGLKMFDRFFAAGLLRALNKLV